MNKAGRGSWFPTLAAKTETRRGWGTWQKIEFSPLTYYELRYIVNKHMARKPKAGPASDPEMLILASLAAGPKHGYAIMSDIEAFSGVAVGPGTLYTAITRLVEKKLIIPKETPGRQRPYEITRSGASLLTTQLQEMQHVASAGLERLRLI
jgi:DNA-binding PadR family transcriptional regulator